MTVEEKNREIAGYEQRKFYGKTIEYFGGDTGNTMPEMHYHTSWNWLMEAWQTVLTGLRRYSEHEANSEHDRALAYMKLTDIAHVIGYGRKAEAHTLIHEAIQFLNSKK